jgi:hypothetical protein
VGIGGFPQDWWSESSTGRERRFAPEVVSVALLSRERFSMDDVYSDLTKRRKPRMTGVPMGLSQGGREVRGR